MTGIARGRLVGAHCVRPSGSGHSRPDAVRPYSGNDPQARSCTQEPMSRIRLALGRACRANRRKCLWGAVEGFSRA